MEPDDLVTYHEHMRVQNQEKIEIAYLSALKKGIADPTVLVLDIRSTQGQAILSVAIDKERIKAHLLEADERELEPIVTWNIPTSVAADLLDAEWPDVAQELRELSRHGTFPFACISKFGVSLGLCPIPRDGPME